MKFKTFWKMRSSPNFKVNADMEPIGLDAGLEGAFEAGVGAISASIGEIPVKVAIPFLKRRGKILVASVGGFKVKLDPFHVKLDCARLHLKGVLGQGGIKGSMECKVACRTEADMSGEVTGKPGILKLDLGEEESVRQDTDDGEDVCR